MYHLEAVTAKASQQYTSYNTAAHGACKNIRFFGIHFKVSENFLRNLKMTSIVLGERRIPEPGVLRGLTVANLDCSWNYKTLKCL